jgi:hypothetical protein
VRSVCRIAKDLGASLTFACDTADQVERAAKMARKLLPNHERTALERMCEAKTRARSNLN